MVRHEVTAGLNNFLACLTSSSNSDVGPKTGNTTAQGVFLATILVRICRDDDDGLYASLPYAQAPGMGA